MSSSLNTIEDSFIFAPSLAMMVPLIVTRLLEMLSEDVGDIFITCGSGRRIISSVIGSLSESLDITISGDTPIPDLGGF